MISVNINGTAQDDTLTLLNAPTGLVLFNNRLMGYGSATLEYQRAMMQAFPRVVDLMEDNLLPTDGFDFGGDLFTVPSNLLSGFGYSGLELNSMMGDSLSFVTPDKMKSWVDVRILGF